MYLSKSNILPKFTFEWQCFLLEQFLILTRDTVAVKVHEKATELHAIASLTVMMNNENHNTIEQENQNGGRQVAPVCTGSNEQASNCTAPSVSNGKIHNSDYGDTGRKCSQISAQQQPEVITVAIPARGSEDLHPAEDGPSATADQMQVCVCCVSAV